MTLKGIRHAPLPQAGAVPGGQRARGLRGAVAAPRGRARTSAARPGSSIPDRCLPNWPEWRAFWLLAAGGRTEPCFLWLWFPAGVGSKSAVEAWLPVVTLPSWTPVLGLEIFGNSWNLREQPGTRARVS